MSQGESGSVPDQLAHWDRVREAGIALSRQVTTLTTDHKQSSASGEIFQRLLPACFEWVRARTEATFSSLNASLPTLLCRFVSPDQVGQIFFFHLYLYVQLQHGNLRDGHGPDRSSGVYNSQHLPGAAVPLGKPMSDHTRYCLYRRHLGCWRFWRPRNYSSAGQSTGLSFADFPQEEVQPGENKEKLRSEFLQPGPPG